MPPPFFRGGGVDHRRLQFILAADVAGLGARPGHAVGQDRVRQRRRRNPACGCETNPLRATVLGPMRSAMARPMPLLEPVITATLPVTVEQRRHAFPSVACAGGYIKVVPAHEHHLQAIVMAIPAGCHRTCSRSAASATPVIPAGAAGIGSWTRRRRNSCRFLVDAGMSGTATTPRCCCTFWARLVGAAAGRAAVVGDADKTRANRRLSPADRGRDHSGRHPGFRAGEIPFRSLFGLAGDGRRFPGAERLLADVRASAFAPAATGRCRKLTIMDALIISACWQCAALIPGISRSGATIVGGY